MTQRLKDPVRRGKSAIVWTRLKLDEFRNLESLAEARDVKLSELVRGVLRGYIEAPDPLRVGREKP